MSKCHTTQYLPDAIRHARCLSIRWHTAMITEDQSQTVAFLSSPAAHAGAAVERIDTHASIVFLVGTRAWKLKRSVRYDYLDYSTADKRMAMCEAEVRVNRRT